MIFERRGYTMRPGNIGKFWDLQRIYHTNPAYQLLAKQNLCYFATLAGRTEEVVHLYRFDSVQHWKATYDQLYKGQNPEYFKQARPLMLRQENGFYGPPPIAELAGSWMEGKPRPPAGFKTPAGGAVEIRVIESSLEFYPGGLPVYWDAYRDVLNGNGELVRSHLMAVLVSQVGRIHRVLHYRCFATTAAGEAHEAALAADPHWRKFLASFQGLVAEATTTVLQPSPLPLQRSLFE